jgi:hypothetical protein
MRHLAELLRALVFITLAVVIAAGPYLRQVRHMDLPWLGQWVMFVGYGLDVCDVRYYAQHTDGTREELDRYELLDLRPETAPHSVRTVGNLAAADRLGQRLCKADGHPEPDIRLWARCATRQGWKREDAWRRNLCTLEPGAASPARTQAP